MTLAQFPLWRRILYRILITRPLTRLGMVVAGRIDPLLMRISNGRVYSMKGIGLQSVMLTTTGAKTGKLRQVVLLTFEEDGNLIVLGSRGGDPRHPGWYHNMKANPHVAVIWQGREEARIAREAESTERERLWARAMSVYPAFDQYQVRTGGTRRIPVIVLEPPLNPTH